MNVRMHCSCQTGAQQSEWRRPWATFWTNPAELERPHRCPLWPGGSSGAGVSGVLPIPALIAAAEAFGRGAHASEVSNLEGLGLGRYRPDEGLLTPITS